MKVGTMDADPPASLQRLRTAMNDGKERIELSLAATNRRGRSIDCLVTLVPFDKNGGDTASGMLLMMTEPEAVARDGDGDGA